MWLLAVHYLGPPALVDFVVTLSILLSIPLWVQGHPGDGPWAPALVGVSLERRRRSSVEVPRVSLPRRGRMLAFPFVPSLRGRIERDAGPVAFAPAPIGVAAPLERDIGVEAGEAAVSGVEVQGREVLGQAVLGRRGASGRVDGGDL